MRGEHFPQFHGLGRGVLELKIKEDGDAYRVVYVATFEEAIYVLDAFQKKSPTGSKLPHHIQSRIRDRYQVREEAPTGFNQEMIHLPQIMSNSL